MTKAAKLSPRSPSVIDVYFGMQIRKARLERHISQQDLGEALGVSFQQIQKYEKGVNRIAASRLFEICQVLSWPIINVFGGVPSTYKNAHKVARRN